MTQDNEDCNYKYNCKCKVPATVAILLLLAVGVRFFRCSVRLATPVLVARRTQTQQDPAPLTGIYCLHWPEQRITTMFRPFLSRASRVAPQQFIWKQSFHFTPFAEAKLNIEQLAERVNLKGENVLVRVDLNVPLDKVRPRFQDRSSLTLPRGVFMYD